jgi:diadenosine tetraphosphate (Ap4A) HIT family hydrolase
LFCSIAAGITDPGACLAVNDEFAIFPALHQRPNNRGQMLLVPVGHYAGLVEMPTEKAVQLLTALQAATQAVKTAFRACGTTVRLNLGPPAQEIFHLHWHITPRHADDDFKTSRSEELTIDERLRQTAMLGQRLVKQSERCG